MRTIKSWHVSTSKLSCLFVGSTMKNEGVTVTIVQNWRSKLNMAWHWKLLSDCNGIWISYEIIIYGGVMRSEVYAAHLSYISGMTTNTYINLYQFIFYTNDNKQTSLMTQPASKIQLIISTGIHNIQTGNCLVLYMYMFTLQLKVTYQCKSESHTQ